MLAAKADGPDAHAPELLADINQTTSFKWSGASEFTPFGGHVYFSAETISEGRELWRTDGTPKGTELFLDLMPGVAGSHPNGFILFQDRLWFSADHALWSTDDTRQGTKREVPGRFFWDPALVAGGLLFFDFGEEEHGSELWVTDGTPDGTRMVADLDPGPAHSSPQLLASTGDTVLFLAHVPGLQGTIWRSDGTAEGTWPLPSHCQERCPSPRLVPFGGVWVFAARASRDAPAILWQTDGTVEGTRPLVELPTDDRLPYWMVAIGPDLYFAGWDEEHGTELWRTDGTPEGTTLVRDLVPGPESSAPGHFVAVGDEIFFTGDTGWGTQAIFRSNGSAPGTRLVLQVASNRILSHLAALPDAVLFNGPGGLYGALYRTDGTREGTFVLSKGVAFEHRLIGEQLFFTMKNPDVWNEPWVSDGTAAGTRVLRDIAPDVGDSLPRHVATLRDRIVFTADDGVADTELWSTDGTPEGTASLGDLVPGPDWVAGRVATDDWVIFGMGGALWRSDGTRVGTSRLRSFDHLNLGAGTDPVFLGASDPVHGTELWITDGTTSGTRLLRDIRPGPESSDPWPFAASGSGAFFLADDGVHGMELWYSDGTPAGTRLTRDLMPGPDSSEPWELTPSVGGLFYLAKDPAHGRALWFSDGTEPGTRLILDPDASGPYGSPHDLVSTSNLLFFLAKTPEYGKELWRSDGTASGTMPLDLTPGPESMYPDRLFAVGRTLFFSMYDETEGPILWRTDGSVEGTRRVANLNPEGRLLDYAEPVLAVGERLLFAFGPGDGRKLYITDGTEEGTLPVVEERLLIETRWHHPRYRDPLRAVLGDHLILGAFENSVGGELFAVRIPSGDTVQMLSGAYLGLFQRRAHQHVLIRSGAGSELELPAAGASDDPTHHGASLTLLGTAAGNALHIELPSEGWRRTRRGTLAYRDRRRTFGPCLAVDVRKGYLRVACSVRLALDLDEPRERLALELALGTSPGATRLCLEFGGQVIAKRPGLFVARRAPPPEECLRP